MDRTPRTFGFRTAQLTLNPPVTLGVLADTHVPDRFPHLPAEVEAIFREAGVTVILHAGDVTHPGVLRRLARIAPVYAVRGNRDFLLWWRLPARLRIRIGPIAFTLVHGHGGLWRYAVDKVAFFLGHPLTFREIEDRTWAQHRGAQVLILGHTHMPILRPMGRGWLFNPGSPTVPPQLNRDIPRAVGLVHVSREHRLRFQWILL